jgi:hypothetical protein
LEYIGIIHIPERDGYDISVESQNQRRTYNKLVVQDMPSFFQKTSNLKPWLELTQSVQLASGAIIPLLLG